MAWADTMPKALVGKNVTIGKNVVLYDGVVIDDDVTIYDNSIIGRPAHRPGHSQFFSSERTYIGPGSVIGSGTTIYTGTWIGKNVLIGDGVRIRENCEIMAECIVGSNCTFQNNVIMFPRSRVIDLSHITAGVLIGENAFVSTGVLTMNDDSFNGNNAEGDTTLNAPQIGAGASVGGGAVLLPGVIVGHSAVVAAGAIVTKDVEAGTTVMGVAAKRRYLQPIPEVYPK